MKRKPEKPVDQDFYVEILVRTLRDAAKACSLRPSQIERDILTIQSRTRDEGMSFLTKTLPSLGKCLDKALSKEVPLPEDHNFPLTRKLGSRLPVFLGAFWKLCLEADGRVRVPGLVGEGEGGVAVFPQPTSAQAAAIRAIRQVCYLFYKLDGSYDLSAEAKVINDFVETDHMLPDEEEEVPLSRRTEDVIANARFLIGHVLSNFDPQDIRPGHGPGAVATGEAPWEKMNFSRYYAKLDEMYPYSEYFFFNYSHLCDELESLESLKDDEPTAKVVLVPKDSRGPRLISEEPLEIQWIQQGVMRELFKIIESPQSLTAGYVNFTDQSINQGLALLHSVGPLSLDENPERVVTIDMKEASDRVSTWLVRKLFPDNVFKALKASRSTHTLLPDGHRLRLRKFAPMGSAVCFPIEALIFWALAVGSGVRSNGWINLFDLPEVWVYGDDIITHKWVFDEMRPVFEELFLQFNEDKCCTGRFFRESCGVDAFDGTIVTPLRIKTPWERRLSPATALSYVGYVNNLRLNGYLEAAEYLAGQITSKFGPVPRTNDKQRSLFAIIEPDWTNEEVRDYLVSTFKCRYNTDLQREEVKIPYFFAPVFKRGEPGWSELLRLAGQIGSSCLFGFDPPRERPCRYTVPRRLKRSGKWTAVERLYSQA